MEFADEPPDDVSANGSSTWYVRGQNFVLAFTRLVAGDGLVRRGQCDEYVVLSLDGELAINSGDESIAVSGTTFSTVPPGDSEICAVHDASLVRLFDHRTADLLDRSRNATDYARPDERCTPLAPWPEPIGGHRLRSWAIDDITEDPTRFGRIFRSRAFMVNFLHPQMGPRDSEALSPHHHDDFEQFSLVVQGTYVHHIRTPWTTRRSQWREDEHRKVGSPSVTIIPPPTVHTSEAVGEGVNLMIDIFCPPRLDFSTKPGWVLNADDYPMP
ncbi:hypothetical protein LQ384_26120 [Rhodococcus rhodochrous]|uniref:Cupin n=1 Tax=Rhodococcus rhodochrous TaxID=1829 RepID=A0AAW4XNW1_RHORH|nr:hypothetical protein [Rhodococcus rhodochrous]MCD2114584.1 hypothetical protein [Rhodococcus rhodochrous]